jgi:TPP-dependent pyruvate/acetoin dehydrogenase alpha subunit
MGPHSSSDDPARYRDAAETERWLARDPIALLRERLLADGLLSPEADAALSAELNLEIEQAVTRAEAAAPPAASTLFDDVYALRPRHLEEQAEQHAATNRRATGS